MNLDMDNEICEFKEFHDLIDQIQKYLDRMHGEKISANNVTETLKRSGNLIMKTLNILAKNEYFWFSFGFNQVRCAFSGLAFKIKLIKFNNNTIKRSLI